MILQKQALISAIGRGHVSKGRLSRPCSVGLTLTLEWFFRPHPVWPGPEALDWRLLIHNTGLWVPPTWKMCHMAVYRTLLAGETSIPHKDTHTFRGYPHQDPRA